MPDTGGPPYRPSPRDDIEVEDDFEAPRPFLDRLARPALVGRSAEGDDSETVRPYYLTGGRTQADQRVNVETMALASGRDIAGHDLDPEQRHLLHLAVEPLAVAEIAVHLGVPVGVAMVFVSDLAAAGLLTLSYTSASSEDAERDDVALLKKVISGVRSLRNAAATL